jgi:hypothetical protein
LPRGRLKGLLVFREFEIHGPKSIGSVLAGVNRSPNRSKPKPCRTQSSDKAIYRRRPLVSSWPSAEAETIRVCLGVRWPVRRPLAASDETLSLVSFLGPFLPLFLLAIAFPLVSGPSGGLLSENKYSHGTTARYCM